VKTKYKLAIALVAGAAIGGAAIQGLHAQAKPPVYTVSEIDVTNVAAYEKEFARWPRQASESRVAKFLLVAKR
jgi:hypothetical protein